MTNYHYIKDWMMRSAMMNSKVHQGCTTGEMVLLDHKSVREECSDNPVFILMGVVDSAGSMGKLGEHL